MGAPLRNQNYRNGKRWKAAIDAALEEKSRVDQRDALTSIAAVLVIQAQSGDLQAIKELGDRLDGKATQQTEISGPDGEALKASMTVEFVGPVPRET